ncbi:MAG TPA: hypothetical protein VJL84_01820 [Kiloniellales bacterium]|nr:hypothetical protein [Kiloniellales bacterium]
MRACLGLTVGALSVVGALLLAGTSAAQAQSEEVAALEARIKALEDKLAEIEQDGLKVKGPFSVVNAAGNPIFQVMQGSGDGVFVFIGGEGGTSGGAKILMEAGTSASAGGVITVNGSGGSTPAFQAGEIGGKAQAIVGDKAAGHVLLSSDGSAVEVTAQQAEGKLVKMELSGETAAVKAESNGSVTTLGEAGGTVGVVLEIGGSKKAELSKWADRQYASVRIYGGADAVAAGLGVDINNPNAGLLTVFSSGDTNGVVLNGEGTVAVKRDGTEKIKLDATKQTITMSGSTPDLIKLDAGKQTLTVKGTGSQQMVVEGAKGFTAQNGEKKLATLGFSSAGTNGQLWVFSGSGFPVLSATAEGSGGEVIVGDESTPHIKLSTDNGQAEIAAEGGGQNAIAMLAASGMAQLRADTEGYATAFGKLDGQVGMTIEAGNRLLGEFSKPNDRNAASLRVYGSSGQIVAGLGGQSGDAETGLVVASGPSGQAMLTGEGWLGLKENDALKVVASAADKVIALYGAGSEYIVTLSPGSSGGGNITTYDTGGTGVFSAGAATDGGGEACVIRQGNKLHCLGVGLPLMGGGN